MAEIWEPVISGILDLVITWKATFVVTCSSRQKTDSTISKSNSSVRRGLYFRRKLFVILRSAVQKLSTFSILPLLITNYCVCVKRITLGNRVSSSVCFSASRVRNIGASHIWDFGPCHDVKPMFYVTSSFRQKTDSVISKKNSSLRQSLSFRKKLFVILYSVEWKLINFQFYRYH